MQPRKDYDDFSKYINDSFTDDKVELLNKSLKKDLKRLDFNPTKKSHNPLLSLKTYSEVPQIKSFNRHGFKSTRMRESRNLSTAFMNCTATDQFNVQK